MATEQPILRFDATTPAVELREAVTHLAARAHSRIQHIVGTPDHPSEWDIAHRDIDWMLVLLEAR